MGYMNSQILEIAILGILGAALGGLLGSLLLGVGVTGFNLTSLIISLLGGLLLVAASKMSRTNKI